MGTEKQCHQWFLYFGECWNSLGISLKYWYLAPTPRPLTYVVWDTRWVSRVLEFLQVGLMYTKIWELFWCTLFFFLMELSLIITVFKFPFIVFFILCWYQKWKQHWEKVLFTGIMPSEISQRKKEKYYMISLICGIF